jgi:hypothetical protein
MPSTREPLRPSRLDLIWGSVAGLLIEMLTCILRFGIKLQSTRDTTFIGRFTFGYRVHHGYIGLIAILAALSPLLRGRVRVWTFRVGLALLLSDLLHHFVVLWITTGSPQFDLVYPR